MVKQFNVGIRMVLVMTLLTGLVYPALVTGLAQTLFPTKANGSLIERNGKVVGSGLIGQRFTMPGYFHGRPSAAGSDGYDAGASGGSNLGPTNKKLADRVRGDIERFRKENPGYTGPIPADMLTTSASGLDPHISPASAEAQVSRIAKTRGLEEDRVRQLVSANTEGRQFGVLGEPRVNVLKLNLALEKEVTAAPIRRIPFTVPVARRKGEP